MIALGLGAIAARRSYKAIMKRSESAKPRRIILLVRMALRSDLRFPTGLNFGDDREPVTCGRPRKDGTIPTLFPLEISLLRDRHCLGFGPVSLVSLRNGFNFR